MTLISVSTFAAMGVLPYEHLEPRTAALAAELSRRLLAADIHEGLAWETFDVPGSGELDLRGGTWHEYWAAGGSRRPFDRATPLPPPCHVPTESA